MILIIIIRIQLIKIRIIMVENIINDQKHKNTFE